MMVDLMVAMMVASLDICLVAVSVVEMELL
jgi:hypothetical protein